MVSHKHTSSMLTSSEVAHLLSVHVNTVRRWTSQGIIKVYRIGPRGDRRFRREDIASFLIESKANRGNDSKAASINAGHSASYEIV